MNRVRVFGSDVPFMAWLRQQNVELPSYSPTCGFVATDIDLHVHRYLQPVDNVGSREVQALMLIEVKTRSGEPRDSQRDTLFKVHATRKRCVHLNGQTIRNFGVSFLKLSDTTPTDSQRIWWGRFDKEFAIIKYRTIDLSQLYQLLRFDIHPESFCPTPFRRHHLTKTVVQVVKTELGFDCEEHIVHRS